MKARVLVPVGVAPVLGQEMVEVVQHDLVQRLVLQCEHVRVERDRRRLAEREQLRLRPARRDGDGAVVLEQRLPHKRVQQRRDEEREHGAGRDDGEDDGEDSGNPRRRGVQKRSGLQHVAQSKIQFGIMVRRGELTLCRGRS